MIYKIIYIIMLFVFILSGCSKADNIASSNDVVLDMDSEVSTVQDSQKETSSLTELFESMVTDNSDTSEDRTLTENKKTESSAKKKEPSSVTSKNSTKEKEEIKKETSQDKTDTSAEAEGNVSSKVDEETKTENVVSNEPEESSSTEEKTEDKTEEKTDERPTETPSIVQSDYSVQVANYVAQLLNEERIKIGVPKRNSLTGLNKIAVYRSVQITEQFSHNWVDANGKSWQAADYAAAQFKYGKHYVINETRFDVATGTVVETGNVIETYSYGGTENIAKGGIYSNNAEELAKYIVTVFKSSSNHWNSLMREDKLYDGIGVTISGDYWYCSINSSEINYG